MFAHEEGAVKKIAQVVALASAVALAAGACGARPEQTGGSSGGGGGGGTSASNFHACMVSDSGGIDDRSFNESAWRGMQQAHKDFAAKVDFLESDSNSDYVPNINKFLKQDCNLIVTVGFLMSDATVAAAKKHSDQKFAIVDQSYDKKPDNLKPLVFDTAQAAFLGGYLAAGMTDTGKVATFGGQKIPTVTIFMDGYWEGVKYYNKKHGTDVKVLGWNEKSQQGAFTGDFTDQSKGKQLTQQFINQGADIVHPVAGPVGLGAAAAAKDAGGRVKLIWVDSDGCVSAQQYCKLFLSSVVKSIDTSVETVLKKTKNGKFSGEQYVGTLDNGGVSLAPYHKNADAVPDKLEQQIKQVKKDIMSGKIEINSPASPKH